VWFLKWGQFVCRKFVIFLCIIWLLFDCQYQGSWLPGKTRPQNDQLCVEWDDKLYSLTHSLTHSLTLQLMTLNSLQLNFNLIITFILFGSQEGWITTDNKTYITNSAVKSRITLLSIWSPSCIFNKWGLEVRPTDAARHSTRLVFPLPTGPSSNTADPAFTANAIRRRLDSVDATGINMSASFYSSRQNQDLKYTQTNLSYTAQDSLNIIYTPFNA